MGEIEISERSGGVRVVRLNRPDRLNALTPEMVRLITEAMEAGPDHRAIVITGNGRGFCAGVDIAGAHERHQGRSNADALALQEWFGGMVLAIARAPVPVISAVNGPAAGAGMAIALASDVRIGSDTARFIIGGPNIGLSAGECGISYFLPRIRGTGPGREIMLTNRHVHAAEALSIGLVTELAAPGELETATGRLTEAIVSLSPFGKKMTKQVYRANLDASSLEEALQLENRTQILATAAADAAEARAAFLEKRRPSFTGR